MLVRALLLPLRMRPRVQRASGIPCALLFSRGRENYLQTSGELRREIAKLFPRRPGLEPGPITTGFGCYAKSSNSVSHDERHGVWGPAQGRDDGGATLCSQPRRTYPATETQLTHSTTALLSRDGLLNRCGRRLAKRKLSPCFSVQLSASTVSFISPSITRPASSPSCAYNSSPVLPPGSMWTRNRLSRPSDPAGLSSCLEIPVRHRFNLARAFSRVTIASRAVSAFSLAPNNPAIPTPSTSASVASTRSDGEDSPRSIWLRKPIDRSVRSATVSSDSLRPRRSSRIRCPTATSIAGALAARLLIRLLPLTSNHFLHAYENPLQRYGQCDHNFMVVKIGLDGETHRFVDDAPAGAQTLEGVRWFSNVWFRPRPRRSSLPPRCPHRRSRCSRWVRRQP